MLKEKDVFINAISRFSPSIRDLLMSLPASQMEIATEVRLLTGFPPVVRAGNEIFTHSSLRGISPQELSQSFVFLCKNSVHSFQEEFANGYIHLDNGHRAGIGATAVYDQNGKLINLRDINSIVLRIAREHKGVSNSLCQEIFSAGMCSVMIAGPPYSGKTTMLRDMAQVLSTAEYAGFSKVAVVDERGELASCANGCCLLKGYKKADGIMLAVRNLSPEIILCDELGGKDDTDAIKYALNCGVSVVTTVHAKTFQELARRKGARELLETGGFTKAVLLDCKPVPSIIKGVVNVADIL